MTELERPKTQKVLGFCNHCITWVYVRLSDGECPRCNKLIIKKMNYDLYKKLFDIIIEQYEEKIEKNPDETFPIVIGRICYFIPSSKFKHYKDVRENSLKGSNHKLFFHDLMNSCEKKPI